MATNTNGYFDRVIQISETLIGQMASETMGVSVTIAMAEDDYKGAARASGHLSHVWFHDEPKQWVPSYPYTPGQHSWKPSNRHRDGGLITLVITLDVAVELSSVKIEGVWSDTSDPVYEKFRHINFSAAIEITDTIEVRRLAVAPDPDRPYDRADALCALIDLNPQFQFPLIDVSLNVQAIRNAPVMLLRYAATQVKLGAPEAEQEFTTTVASIQGAISVAVANSVREITDPRIEEKGIALLFETMRAPVAQMEKRTLGNALIIGMNAAEIHGSNINLISQLQGGPVDDMVITINHRTLIRQNLLPALLQVFRQGLTRDDFAKGFLCRLKSAVHVQPDKIRGEPRPDSFELTALEAYVDEAGLVRIRFSISSERLAGQVKVAADLDLKIKFMSKTGTFAAGQGLSLAPVLTNPDTAVVSQKSEVAPGAVIAATVLGGLLGTFVSIAVQIIADKQLTSALQAQTAGVSLSPSVEGLPSLVWFDVSSVSLHQEDAEPVPGQPGIDGLRLHDLVIALKSIPLPQALIVDCQVRDRGDSDRRIDAIGGLFPANGRRWLVGIDDAIAMIEAGSHEIVVRDPIDSTKLVPLVVRRPPNGVPFLVTPGNEARADNLGDLPSCVSDV